MKIVSWNVNGLRAVYNKENFLDFLEKESPDLLFLQETKVLQEQLTKDQTTPLNYKLIINPAEKKGYSGVACFYKNNLKVSTFSKKINIKEFDSEGRFLLVEYSGLYFFNIYFPSGTTGDIRQDFKYKFLDALYEYLAKLPKKIIENLILLGDVNICHKDIDIHHPQTARKKQYSGFLEDEQAWVSKLEEFGFIDTYRELNKDIQKFSWWSYRANSRAKNLGWRIDYIFINKKLKNKLKHSNILDQYYGSDHAPISCVLDN